MDMRKFYRRRMAILCAVFVVSILLSFCIGRYMISPVDIIKILLSRVFNITKTWTDSAEAIVLSFRPPRIISAIIIGAGLSVAGTAYQGMFRNPMASPDVLGASSGAGFGAALAILLGAGWAMISLTAFFFGIVSVLLAYALARIYRNDTVSGLIIMGMIVSALFNSGTNFVKLVADTDSVLPAITYWLMGSLSSIRMSDLFPGTFPIIIGCIILFLLRWRINLLSASDDEAKSMGVNTTALRLIIIVCSTFITAACVALSGIIGWVGLVIPHFCRILFGDDNRWVIPSSMVLGAAFLLIADTVSRSIMTLELPIGILTTVIGAPVFIYLALVGRRNRD